MNISEIDRNFSIETKLPEHDIAWAFIIMDFLHLKPVTLPFLRIREGNLRRIPAAYNCQWSSKKV